VIFGGRMTTPRQLAIGDVHGYKHKLEALIEKVAPTAIDRVVFLGDLIDRGPDSRGVIDFVLAFCRRYPKTVVLRGNHEDLLLRCLDDPTKLALFLRNGGTNTLNSYGGKSYLNFMPPEHLDFLRSRPLYHLADSFLFVHAGLYPDVLLENQEEQDMLWIRNDFLNSDFDWGPVVVTGHTPQLKPVNLAKRIVLDTGVCYPEYGLGKLTCCDVLTRTFWQA
jgi:serine/threonine protein phosphatase 1